LDPAAGRAADAAVRPDSPPRALAGLRLLDAWDHGADQDHLDRALMMLAASRPETSPGQLAGLSIAARNRELLRLRWITFGPALGGFTACGACGARLEFSVSVPEVLDRLSCQDTTDALAWDEGGASCTLRAATTDDLRDAVLAPDDEDARRRLLVRCVSVTGAADPDAALASVCANPETADRFDRLHAGAEIRCEVVCAQCGSADVVDLDIAGFLWDEVRHAAMRLLREVHDLASAYGWSEAAVAEMSGRRRRAYLEMVWA
jgi:hypothetical protein